MFGALPIVGFRTHPGRTFPFDLNVTTDGTVKLTVMVIAVRKVANFVAPGRENELKSRTSATSVTVIVIA
jgi:hypothetical protein